MVMEVNLGQYQKQESPKLVTELGMVMEVKPWQYKKHSSSKLATVYSSPPTVIFGGITTSPEYLWADVPSAVTVAVL